MGREPESASCVEYDSQAEEEIPESKKLANVGSKRSSNNIAAGTIVEIARSDLASDSGYSSRTQATSATTDSAASIKQKVAAAHDLAVEELPSAGPSRRKTDTESLVSGTSSTATKKKKLVKCKDPECDKCVAAREAARAARKKEEQQRERKPRVSISANVSPAKSPEKSPVRSAARSPQKPAIIQSAGPQPRRRDSQQQGPRPTSMYEMMPPRGGYIPAGAGPLTVVERPGPMISARGGRNTGGRSGPAQYDMQRSGKISARRVMNPAVVQQERSDAQVRQKMAGNEDRARRQMAAQQLAAQKAAAHRERELRQRQSVVIDSEEEEESGEYLSEEEEESDEESEEDMPPPMDPRIAIQQRRESMGMAQRRPSMAQRGDSLREMQQQLAAAEVRQRMLEQEKRLRLEKARAEQMPPPPPPAPSVGGAQRNGYSMRKTQAQITYSDQQRRQSQLDPLTEQFRDSLRSAAMGANGSSAVRRPSLTPSGGTKSYSHPFNPHIMMEPNRNPRRTSWMGQRPDELEDMHHEFQLDSQESLKQLITDAVQSQLQNLNLTPTQQSTVQFDIDDKLRNAMQYQTRIDAIAPGIGGLPGMPQSSMPLTQDALRRQAAIPSTTGSSRSKRSSDEDIISTGHRLTMGSDAGGVQVNGNEMKVRIDTTNGFEMEFDGRTVILNPIGDGSTAELIIGGKRDATATQYTSTKGSTATRSVIGRQPSMRQPQPTSVYDREDHDDERTTRDDRTVRGDRRTVYPRERAPPPRREPEREREYVDRRDDYHDYERRERRERREQREPPRRPQRAPRRATDESYDSYDDYSSEEDERRAPPARPVRRDRANTYDYPPRRGERRRPPPDRREYHY